MATYKETYNNFKSIYEDLEVTYNKNKDALSTVEHNIMVLTVENEKLLKISVKEMIKRIKVAPSIDSVTGKIVASEIEKRLLALKQELNNKKEKLIYTISQSDKLIKENMNFPEEIEKYKQKLEANEFHESFMKVFLLYYNIVQIYPTNKVKGFDDIVDYILFKGNDLINFSHYLEVVRDTSGLFRFFSYNKDFTFKEMNQFSPKIDINTVIDYFTKIYEDYVSIASLRSKNKQNILECSKIRDDINNQNKEISKMQNISKDDIIEEQLTLFFQKGEILHVNISDDYIENEKEISFLNEKKDTLLKVKNNLKEQLEKIKEPLKKLERGKTSNNTISSKSDINNEEIRNSYNVYNSDMDLLLINIMNMNVLNSVNAPNYDTAIDSSSINHSFNVPSASFNVPSFSFDTPSIPDFSSTFTSISSCGSSSSCGGGSSCGSSCGGGGGCGGGCGSS